MFQEQQNNSRYKVKAQNIKLAVLQANVPPASLWLTF